MTRARKNLVSIEANKRDMPYQSLIKAWLADDVEAARNKG